MSSTRESSPESIRSRSPQSKRVAILEEENRRLRQRIDELLTKIQELENTAQTRHQELIALLQNRATSQEAPNDPPPAPMEAETSTGKRGPATTTSSSEEEDEGFTTVNRKKKKKTTKEPRRAPEEPPAVHPEAPESPPTQASRGSKKTAPAAPKEDTKQKAIPAVILRNQERWSEVSRMLRTEGVRYTKARLVQGMIHIHPQEANDHRNLTRMLSRANEEYHTYSLPDEKQLRVVIRGVPASITNEEVKEDLVERGFAPAEVLRMRSRRRGAMPLVLVKLPTEQDTILQLTRCCSLVVRVERQRKDTARVAQCYRCQHFGHAQSNCAAVPRCVKCGEQHASATCEKPREEAAKCANCAGAHPASYGGCPKRPKPQKKRTPPPPPQRKAAPSTAPQVQAGRSFAAAAKGNQAAAKAQRPVAAAAEATPQVSAASLNAALAQMQQMCSAMSAFFAKMPATFTA